MKWFKSTKDEKLKQLLKTSGSDFQFDPTATKYRLMTSITDADQKPRPHFHLGRVARYSLSFAAVVVFLSGTFAFAFNSQPGDALFSLNKLGEQAVLNLPLSDEQKANVETYIVNSRLQALDQVQVKNIESNSKMAEKNLAAIKETDDSFASAVENISKNQKTLQDSGKTQAAAKLNDKLNKLQIEAQKHEAAIKAFEDQTTDKDAKAKIQAHLSKLRASGQKAREQIKQFQIKLDKNNQGKSEKNQPDKSSAPESDTTSN